MFQRAIDLQTWADIFEGLTTYAQTVTGAILTTTGMHPDLGAVVAVQDDAELMILLSEMPTAALLDLIH